MPPKRLRSDQEHTESASKRARRASPSSEDEAPVDTPTKRPTRASARDRTPSKKYAAALAQVHGGLEGEDSEADHRDPPRSSRKGPARPRAQNVPLRAANTDVAAGNAKGKANGDGADQDTAEPPSTAARARAGSRRGRKPKSASVKGKELGGDEGDDDELVADVLDEDDSEAESSPSADDEEATTTPLKKKKKGARPKRATRARTPTPPRDAPAYEQYFFQNRPGGMKTSNNTLSSLSLITHEEYFEAMRKYTDPHQDEMDYLHHLHSRSFDQWTFELEEDYSLCLFGWGSKRFLLASFADHLAGTAMDGTPAPKIVMINGFNPGLTVRDILLTVASTVPALRGTKLGSQPADMLAKVLAALPSTPIYLIVHSLDGAALRRTQTQSILARLSAHPSVHLIASADTPNFALLWDTAIRSQYNFLFHDATTFQPFDSEIGAANGGGGVVDEVNALLGRSGRRVHGREGVVFVLKSLTESARRLFGLLLSEALVADADGAVAEQDGEDEDFEQAVSGKPAVKTGTVGDLGGIEYRALYRKAVQALITGSEMSFRQLLKEFFDHQMVVSRRDALGAEVLSVPFRREECEAILEDLVVET